MLLLRLTVRCGKPNMSCAAASTHMWFVSFVSKFTAAAFQMHAQWLTGALLCGLHDVCTTGYQRHALSAEAACLLQQQGAGVHGITACVVILKLI